MTSSNRNIRVTREVAERAVSRISEVSRNDCRRWNCSALIIIVVIAAATYQYVHIRDHPELQIFATTETTRISASMILSTVGRHPPPQVALGSGRQQQQQLDADKEKRRPPLPLQSCLSLNKH